MDARNVIVVVTRWYGGVHLGPDRFKHINNCTRDLLEAHGYIKDKVSRLVYTYSCWYIKDKVSRLVYTYSCWSVCTDECTEIHSTREDRALWTWIWSIIYIGVIHKGRPHRGKAGLSQCGQGVINDADVRKKYYIGQLKTSYSGKHKFFCRSNYSFSMFIIFTQETHVTFHQLCNVMCLHLCAAVLACSNMGQRWLFNSQLSYLLTCCARQLPQFAGG